MTRECYRTHEVADQQRQPRWTQVRASHPPPNNPSQPGIPSPDYLGLVLGITGMIAALAVGATVLTSRIASRSADQFELLLATDPERVIEYLHRRNPPPAISQGLEERAKRQEFVIWNVTQQPHWDRQQSRTYTLDNGLDRHQFTVRPEGQEFGVLAEASAAGFRFSADISPGNGRMTGIWATPAGRVPYEMRPGQTITIRVR